MRDRSRHQVVPDTAHRGSAHFESITTVRHSILKDCSLLLVQLLLSHNPGDLVLQMRPKKFDEQAPRTFLQAVCQIKHFDSYSGDQEEPFFD